MVFSTPVFLFLFLPVVLLLYALCPGRGRNGLLLAASLLFYAWGTQKLVMLMIASALVNWALGLWIDRMRHTRWSSPLMAFTVAVNLAPLVYYKYTKFLLQTLSQLLEPTGIVLPDPPAIVLPIGISFFTFQAMSYVVDVYRREAAAQRNPLDVALYIALFPQLVAGPIVRYADVAAQIHCRQVTLAGFAVGVERFLLGLGKKVLVANMVATVADSVFTLPNSELSFDVAWLGVLCYSLQIYFDFSGYSDMAIGLGLMFGFRFQENFNYPYISRSITEFWRRWHISLSTWFRDYVYIPLGGNRHGSWRTYRNLLIVFLLCGLWHGASWNFVAWGLFHGLFLIVERRALGAWLQRAFAPLAHAYTLLAVATGWVLFRALDLPHAMALFKAMCGMGEASIHNSLLSTYLDGAMAFVLIAGCLLATPLPLHWLATLANGVRHRCPQPAAAMAWEHVIGLGKLAALTACFLGVAAALSATTYNPFIYYQF